MKPFSVHSSDYAKCLLSPSERKFYNRKLWGIRLWFVKGFEKYLIFYRVFDNYIEIIWVLHSAQDIDSIMEDENIN